jgi:hypothetical protein
MDNLRDTSRRVFEAYNARDLEALIALYAPAARTHRPGWSASGGADEILASARMDMVARSQGAMRLARSQPASQRESIRNSSLDPAARPALPCLTSHTIKIEGALVAGPVPQIPLRPLRLLLRAVLIKPHRAGSCAMHFRRPWASLHSRPSLPVQVPEVPGTLCEALL